LIGFAVPAIVGGAPNQMHWLAVDLPALERHFPNGFRPNEVGLWVATSQGTLHPKAEVPWAQSQNWHPNQLATRGRLTGHLTMARVLLIGGGALGSPVAELLIRAGVINLTVIDGQRLTVGNLVRHTLTIEQLGQWKAEGLARHLNAASPNATVVAEPKQADVLVDAAYLSEFDLVIDATGDHRVLELLERVKAPHALSYVSVAITLHARHLVAYLSQGTSFPLGDFDAAYAPLARAELERGEERPMEGVGCWQPVFPARADQIWLMASAAVGLLNDEWPLPDATAKLHVFERSTDHQGRFAGLARKVA
jgi:Arc/MetJ family transcription regulator